MGQTQALECCPGIRPAPQPQHGRAHPGAAGALADGGLGSDTYRFRRDGLQDDTMRDIGGYDQVRIRDISVSSIWLTRHGDDLHISLLDKDGQLTVEDHFAGEATRVEIFVFGGTYVNANSVDALVNAMAAFTEPQNGLGDLSAADHATVVAAWQQAGVSLA